MHSARIESIVSLAPNCKILADVGCDHGYIGVSALKCGKAQKVLFSDISAPSLNKARLLCERQGLCDRAEFFVGNGLEKIEYADCVVIAGMGGKETIDIIANSHFLPEYFVLQPMRNLPEVREYAAKNFKIEYDKIICDKKFYNLMLIRQGNDSLNEKEKIFGRTNLKDKHDAFKRYVNLQIQKTKNLLNKKPDNEIILNYLKQLAEIAEELNI